MWQRYVPAGTVATRSQKRYNMVVVLEEPSNNAKDFKLKESPWWSGPLPDDACHATVERETRQEEIIVDAKKTTNWTNHTKTGFVTISGTSSATVPAERAPRSILDIWRRLDAQRSTFQGWVPTEVQIQGDEHEL